MKKIYNILKTLNEETDSFENCYEKLVNRTKEKYKKDIKEFFEEVINNESKLVWYLRANMEQYGWDSTLGQDDLDWECYLKLIKLSEQEIKKFFQTNMYFDIAYTFYAIAQKRLDNPDKTKNDKLVYDLANKNMKKLWEKDEKRKVILKAIIKKIYKK